MKILVGKLVSNSSSACLGMEELLTCSADKELVRRYVDLIVAGHDESCLWRSAGCGGSLEMLNCALP